MSKSRILAAAAACALGTSALVVPLAHAATIGPLKDGKCATTYTQAELDADDHNHAMQYPAQVAFLTAGFEALHPGTKAVVQKFQANPDVAKYARREGVTQEQYEAILNASAADLKKLGLSDKQAGHLLVYAMYAKGDPSKSQRINRLLPEHTPKKEEELERWKPASSLEARERDDLNRIAEIVEEPKREAFKKAVQKTTAFRTFIKHDHERDIAYYDTNVACAKGGNATVAFPTIRISLNDSGISASSEGSSSAAGAGDSTLSPGAIAGIVIGVLALLGIVAVAAAPMLGIPLPFELPALPF